LLNELALGNLETSVDLFSKIADENERIFMQIKRYIYWANLPVWLK